MTHSARYHGGYGAAVNPAWFHGALTFVFDDGYQTVFDHVLPLLRSYDVRAVFAVPAAPDRLAATEGAAVKPLSAWKAVCERDGHELAAHGMTHAALPTLSDSELERELVEAQRATGATTLVYPGGAYDARVVAVARRHYRAARTVRRGCELLPPRDPYRLRSFVATKRNFQVWKWNFRVLWAWLTNRWLIETYHSVETEDQGPETGNAANTHTIPLRALEAHLRFLKRLPIRIATIREVVHA